MQERKVNIGLDIGKPARIKQDSESQLMSRLSLSKFFRTVGELLHVNRSLFDVFGGAKVVYSNA